MNDRIELRGVRVHNLKSVDLDIPYGKMVAFCGVSGSGKSSLAIDTLYAEGQRRYIESFSARERKFLERIDKPDAERIDGIPPAISVSSRSIDSSNRTDLASATEIIDHLLLLFARAGVLQCPACGKSVRAHNPESILDELRANGFQRFMIAFAPETGSITDDHEEFIRNWTGEGFMRCIISGEERRIENPGISESDFKRLKMTLDSAGNEASRSADMPPLLVIADRVDLANADPSRIIESLETALNFGRGTCHVLMSGASGFESHRFSKNPSCCGIVYSQLEPRLFRTETPERKAGRLGGKSIDEILAGKISDLRLFFTELGVSEVRGGLGKSLLEPIIRRLGFLEQTGLGYLGLGRTMNTLSTGELRRIALTAALGSDLVDLLYVLDEPTIGLHPMDTERLLQSLLEIRDRGNTIVLVEHNESLLASVDQIVEIGPGAGTDGGEIVFHGSIEEMKSAESSLTGSYLSGRRGSGFAQHPRETRHGVIELFGASGRNLKSLDVNFPLGVLCVVCGPSGAGKSSLVQDTLYPVLMQHIKRESRDIEVLPHKSVLGSGQIDDAVLIDQSPIGRSPRSNPATYLKIFDEIRNVFAETQDARTRNYTAGYFSFNVDGGRCDTCKGEGFLEIDMQFMADLFVKCPECQGKRFRRNVLEITYRNRSIFDVLEMTVREAFQFFRGRDKIQRHLKCLIDVGLDYIRLGQAANTLSGGESQRLKLASHLSRTKKGRNLLIMDEPTAGLHFADIVRLLDCFDSLLAGGHSLIVIEHNLQLIRAADYLIELGPGAGDAGGRIIAQGTPRQVKHSPDSVTGPYL